jgi:hypothetical protein
VTGIPAGARSSPVRIRGTVRLASVPPDPAARAWPRYGVRSVTAPAANNAATAWAMAVRSGPGWTPGIATAGTPPHSAARSASPASGPAITIRSAARAACAIAWANSTGRVTCAASSQARSSSGVIRRPVMVETSRRRGGAKLVAARTLRSGAAHLAMPGEYIGAALSRTSTGTLSGPARLVSSRTPAVDPASTCIRGPS